MVRNYTKKTNQKSWTGEAMDRAVQAVQGGTGKKTAAKDFGVPVMALKRRLNNGSVKKHLGRFNCVFNENQENELVQYIFDMEIRMYGLTARDIRCLAFQLAEKNHINHPFSKEKQAAGQDWFISFKKRHPELTLRSPEFTSVARASGFNKPVVTKFYTLLKSEVVDKQTPAHRIFNVDETSLNTVPGRNSRVLSKKGRKQVARITSAERGISTTAVICTSAGGNFVPPLIIFSRKRIFPFDDTLFNDIDFVAADVTDVAANVTDMDRNTTENIVDSEDKANLEQSIDNQQVHKNVDLSVPSTSRTTPSQLNSGVLSNNVANLINNGIPTTHFYLSSSSQIKPIPKLLGPKKITKRKLGKTVVLTSSPYKNELEAEIKKKEEKKFMKKLKLEKKKEIVKRNIVKVNRAKGKPKSKPTLKDKQRKLNNKKSELNGSSEEDNPDCLLCGESYADSASEEGWIQCATCRLWAHDACAGIEDTMDIFVCDMCLH